MSVIFYIPCFPFKRKPKFKIWPQTTKRKNERKECSITIMYIDIKKIICFPYWSISLLFKKLSTLTITFDINDKYSFSLIFILPIFKKTQCFREHLDATNVDDK